MAKPILNISSSLTEIHGFTEVRNRQEQDIYICGERFAYEYPVKLSHFSNRFKSGKCRIMYWFEFQKVSLILGETRQFLTPQRDSEVLIGLIAWVELTK